MFLSSLSGLLLLPIFLKIVYILQNGLLQIIVIYIHSFIPLSPSLGMKSNQFRSSFDCPKDHNSFIELNKKSPYHNIYIATVYSLNPFSTKDKMQNQIKVILSSSTSQFHLLSSNVSVSHFTGHSTPPHSPSSNSYNSFAISELNTIY